MTATRRREALLLAAALGGTALLATLLRPARPTAPAGPRLDLEAAFPSSFGDWRVDMRSRAFVRPAADQGRRYEIYDQVLERTFVDDDSRRVMLSVASGNDRSTRMQVHLPEVCYRYAGYEVEPAEGSLLVLPDRRVPITRLVARRPGRPEPISYWVVLGDSVVAGKAIWDRLASYKASRDAVDGMLVRISSIDADPAHAWPLHERFARALAAALAPDVRIKVFGNEPA